MTTTRPKDNIIERNVAKFMDEYFWKKIAWFSWLVNMVICW